MFNPVVAKTGRRINALLISLIWLLLGCWILLSIVLSLFPRIRVSPASLIPREYFSLPLKIGVSFACTVSALAIHTNMLAVAQIIMMYVTHMTILVSREFFMEHEQLKGKHRYQTRNSLRTVKNIIVEYRSTEILHLNCMELLGFVMIPMHSIAANLVLFCNFIVITKRDEMNPFVLATLVTWSFGTGMFWYTVLELGRYIYTRGKKTLVSWKYADWGSRINDRIMSRFRKSCRPFMFQYGSTYVMSRRTPLKYLKGLTTGTFRVLLTLKK